MYRNYFAPVKDADGNEQEGQSQYCQINTIKEVLETLGVPNIVTNGYTIARDLTLKHLDTAMTNLIANNKLDDLKS